MEIKDLYTENFKTLRKEMEKENRRWKHHVWSQIGRTESPLYTKQPPESIELQNKILMQFFTEQREKLKYRITKDPG